MNTSGRIKVLMIGVDRATKGGMWTVAYNYLSDDTFNSKVELVYIPTSTVGSISHRLLFTANSLAKFLFYFMKSRPQILHVHMSEKGSVYRKNLFINIGKIFRCKIVIHMHGAVFQQWYSSLTSRKQSGVKRILDKADKIIILGEYWRAFISQLVPESKIAVIYNAVNVPKNNQYNIDARTILFLGVVGQRKGAYDLLKAFASIKDELLGYKLAYYGPDFEEKISIEIKEAKLQDCVQYMGWLKDEEKHSVFKDVVCNVLPSYSEGLPMSILETMAYGIPNISTPVAAIPEVINKDNGIIVEPGDIAEIGRSMIKICKNESQRKSFSENAYQTIKNHFSLERHMTDIVALYRAIL